ncbi:hypothetical protein QBC35DRAFT_549646 [Podospora australis]|uniref:Uncharacterized protein n=1 Tax=Podospora australis TaxID=1536484 RepID=A0AAN7AMN2_9PEZI|nr:hypothetical protein QBC35DRAFT_549646 [Podospora australis]
MDSQEKLVNNLTMLKELSSDVEFNGFLDNLLRVANVVKTTQARHNEKASAVIVDLRADGDMEGDDSTDGDATTSSTAYGRAGKRSVSPLTGHRNKRVRTAKSKQTWPAYTNIWRWWESQNKMLEYPHEDVLGMSCNSYGVDEHSSEILWKAGIFQEKISNYNARIHDYCRQIGCRDPLGVEENGVRMVTPEHNSDVASDKVTDDEDHDNDTASDTSDDTNAGSDM